MPGRRTAELEMTIITSEDIRIAASELFGLVTEGNPIAVAVTAIMSVYLVFVFYRIFKEG